MSPGVGRYVCPRCGERFTSVGDKKRHYRECQEGDEDAE